MQTRNAELLWHRLNGIVCLYKPAMLSYGAFRRAFFNKLANELNEMDCRPQRTHVNIEGDTSKELFVNIGPSYADHPLALGPRYIPSEMKARSVSHLGLMTSGVCVLGINRGVRTSSYLRQCNALSTFRVTGKLGLQTHNKMSTGDIIFRCSNKYIKRDNIDKVVSIIDAVQKKSILALTGVHPQSQDAYEMLAKGLFRPVKNDVPMIYSIKCVELDLPNFTIEVVAANETEEHLINVVFEIGARLRNSATTTSIHCIRNSYFSLQDALLKKHWTLQHVLDNMAQCGKILADNRDFNEFLHQLQREEREELVETAHEEVESM